MKAGRNDHFPIGSDCSIAGMIRLHTLAAVITPAAKPVSAFDTFTLSERFIKNTTAIRASYRRTGSSNLVSQTWSSNHLSRKLCYFFAMTVIHGFSG